MELTIVNQTNEKKWHVYKKDFKKIAAMTEKQLNIKKESSASVIFVTPAQIHKINLEYRHIDRATDVISFALKDDGDDFEMMEGEEELGDIFINVDAVVKQAKEYGHTMRREVCFLFTHGLLHLLGYDHGDEEEEKKMFALQDVILHDIVPKKTIA